MRDDNPSNWLVCRRRRPDAAIRLYCFAHSGGSPGEFIRWADDLPDVEVHGLQLPGRGARLDEAPYTRLPELVAALTGTVEFRAPYAFFGHSLGGYLAYETTRALLASGRAAPVRLLVSACGAPHLPRRVPPLSGLADRELIGRIETFFGPLDPVLHAEPDLLDLAMVAYRADFALLDGYLGDAQRLPVPVTAFGGDRDLVTYDDLAAWAACTDVGFALHRYPGGHFYFRDDREPLLAQVRRELAIAGAQR